MAEGYSPGRDVEDVTDVPPLDDMSELINRVNKLRDEFEVSLGSSTAKSSTKYEETLATKTQKSSSEGQKSMQSAKTFGGFKKGFLNNRQATKGKLSSSSKPLRKEDDIPVIKPKNPKEKNRGMEFPEVQDALKSNVPSLENKDWITEDLLKKIEANPSLAKLLMDPQFTAALSRVQADPMKAMAMLSSNPEMQTALQEFSGILGEHFTALGNSATGVTQTVMQEDIGLSERLTGRRQHPPVPPSPEDEAKMQEILSDPEVLKVLEDPQIQKLLTLMKTNADAAQLEVRNATTETRAKIQKLVDVGLLGFAQ